MSRLSIEQIQKIKESYLDPTMASRDLCALHSISDTTLSRLAQANNWGRRPNRAKHFNLTNLRTPCANDARIGLYGPTLLGVITFLQKQGWVVYRKGKDFICGTHVVSREVLIEKAERYGYRA